MVAITTNRQPPGQRVSEERVAGIVLAFDGRGPASRDPSGVSTVPQQQSPLHILADDEQPQRYPLRRIRFEAWDGWFLGELYSPRVGTEQFLTDFLAGRRTESDLNGHFLLFAHNASTRHWHVWTDRVGTAHAYYASSGHQAAISTSFRAATKAASQRVLDWPALTEFFAFGFFTKGQTHFQDVQILRPATHYIFDENGALVGREVYWRWCHEPDHRRSYSATVEAFGNVLSEVSADHTCEGTVGVPISGGLDSRTLVAGVGSGETSAPANCCSYSYGYSTDSVETRIARRVAAARGLPFRALTIEPYLFSNIERVSFATEGFQDITQCRQAGIHGRIPEFDCLLLGHAGDLWLDDVGLVGRGRDVVGTSHLVQHALQRIEKRGAARLVEQLCQSRLGKRNPDVLLRDAVSEGLEEVEHIEDTDFRLKAFKMNHWVFRLTNASLRMFHNIGFPWLPFYDTRLIDFYTTVPTEYVRGRRLQIDYLKRFAPDLARIPWQAYGTNLYRYGYHHSWLLPKRAVRKAWRILTGRRVIQRNWEVQFLTPEGRAGLERWLLRKGLRLHDFVAPLTVRTLLDDFYANPLAEKRGYTVSMLLTFSTWLETYA